MPKVRKSESDKQNALKFYIMGLTSLEIEKLTNIPHRTLQGYMMREQWKEKRESEREKERLKIIKEYQKNEKKG
jgi:hypothetical protein